MDMSGIIALAVVWFLVSNLISWVSKTSKRPPPTPRPRPRLSPYPAGDDPTQQEGRRLELVLRQVQRALEEAGEQARPVETPRLGYEGMEEGRSLEVEPEVTSLEKVVTRPGRREVDQDDEAEQIAARRLKAVAARDTPRTPVDHTRFDERIRQQPAEHTAAPIPTYTTQRLRDAMVWREILDPPVSLRPGTEPHSWP
jgi:hypothetical protein